MNSSSTLLDDRRQGEPQPPPPLYHGLTLDTWVKVGILGALFIAVYWLVLRWLWDKTNPINGEANWGHAICIPVVGLYYLYINRDELLKATVKPAWIGLGVTLLGLLMFVYGIYPGQNQFFQGIAMIVALFGVVLLLCGWAVMKTAWFPIAYLVCGIPWPPLVYSYIASPLQTLAAKAAVVTLRFTGVDAFRSGTNINIVRMNDIRSLNVAEACAGLRSLMTFITVGAAVAFLSARPLWQKIIITLSAIPIAIFCNVMRVAGQGLLDHYVSEQLSESFAHQFVGLVMLVPAFFMILLVGWILDHIFIEEAEARTAAKAPAPRPAMATATAAPAPAPGISRPAPVKPAASSAHVVNTGTVRTQQAPAAPKSQAPQPAKPVQPVKPAAPAPQPAARPTMPPRPGVVPPRPGIVPPRRPGPTPPKEGA